MQNAGVGTSALEFTIFRVWKSPAWRTMSFSEFQSNSGSMVLLSGMALTMAQEN